MNKLIPIEFKNQRIMTTKILAEEFGTNEDNIKTNFNRNKERFVEGKHYYKLEGQLLKEFKNSVTDSNLVGKNANSLTLWTDRGAARHAKILDTDEAWEVYEELEETYFRVKENKPTCIEDILIAQLQEMKSLKNDVQAIKVETDKQKKEIQGIREVVTLNPNSWRAEVANILNKIAIERGGTQETYRNIRNESYELLDARAGSKLSIRLTNMKRKVLEETGSKSKADKISKLEVIAADKRLTEVYLAIVKDMAIKYLGREACK